MKFMQKGSKSSQQYRESWLTTDERQERRSFNDKEFYYNFLSQVSKPTRRLYMDGHE